MYVLDPMGLSSKLSCESGSFSHHYKPHRFVQPEVLTLVSCTGNLDFAVCLPPQLILLAYLHANLGSPSLPAAALPWALFLLQPFLSLLSVWMNVSSLTPWLPDFHTVRFSGSSGCFFVFKFFVVLLLVCKEAKSIYLCLYLGPRL